MDTRVERMDRYTRFLGVMLGGLCMGLLLAGTSQAAHFVPDKAEKKCRATIAKKFSKLAATADKVIAGCHKSRNKGKVLATVDCNDLSQADSKGKVTKAQDKLKSAIQKSCADAGIDNDVLTEFGSCPEPCASSTGVSSPLADYSELGQCLACLAGDLVESHDVFILGSPDPDLLEKGEQKCHATIAKGYGKYLATILKDRTKCQAAQDKAGSSDITTCFTADSKGKIAKALVKAEAKVEKSCASAALTVIDSCAPTSVAGLNSCLAGETGGTGADLFTASYQRNAPICPAAINTTIIAGPGTKSVLDVGWKGISHDVDLPSDYVIATGLDCSPATGAPCGSCTMTGVSPLGSQYQAFTRCKTDSTIPCNNPFGTDPVCPGLHECTYYLGPPLALSTGNNPTCTFNKMNADLTGTANIETGEGSLQIDLRSQVFLGLVTTQPCATCVGDLNLGDGIKDGTCNGGPDAGQPCDAQGLDKTFGEVSLDCRMDQLSNISGTGLIIQLDLTTGTSSLPFANACDSPLQFLNCACGVCTLDTSFPCRDDADCSAIGAGTCTSIGSGINRLPNECSDGACTDLGNDQGECQTAGPVDKFCDGLLRANGDGFLGCTSDGDCRSIDSECPGGNCGNCTATKTRPCFLDPVQATGTADVNNPLLVTTFCVPPTASASVNTTGGLPGAARVRIDSLTSKIY